jgi:hypothetical protein
MNSPNDSKENPKNRKPNKMNLLIRSLSVLAIGGIFAGTALAGPGDAYAVYFGRTAALTGTLSRAPTVAIWTTRGLSFGQATCPMMKLKTTFIPSGNPKNPGVVERVTGHTAEGCVGATIATMSCKGSRISCQAMLLGS